MKPNADESKAIIHTRQTVGIVIRDADTGEVLADTDSEPDGSDRSPDCH